MFNYNYHRILCSASNADVPRTMTREEFKAAVREWRSFNHVKLKACVVAHVKNDSVYHATGIWSKHCPIWIMSAMNGGFAVRAKAAGAFTIYKKSVAERRKALDTKRDTIKFQRHVNAWNIDLMNVPTA